MAYNRELTDALFPNEKPLLNGVAVGVEGALLTGELEDGIEKVKLSAGGGADSIVGFSTETRLLRDQTVEVKEFAIPSAGPYTIDLGFGNLVADQIRVEDDAGVVAFAEAAVAASGDFSADDATGIMTFHSSDAGLSITVFVKRDLTVVEARELYREGFLHNARAFEVYERVGCFQGKGIIYTDQYDVAADYSTGTLNSAANGLITIGGGGEDLSAKMRVIAVPGLGQPFLGLEFNL